MSIAFTFDDGPGSSTRKLLAVLEKHHCKATFFIIGENLTKNWWSKDRTVDPRAVAIEVVKAGHVLGNHTMTHNARIPLEQFADEIKACDALIADVYAAAGVPCAFPIPFRLPYGIQTYVSEQPGNGGPRRGAALDNRLQALASLGRTHVHWTALLPDWQMSSQDDVRALVKSAISHVEHMEAIGLNAVFAFHDGRQANADAIQECRDLTVQAVDEILTEAVARCWTTMQGATVGFAA